MKVGPRVQTIDDYINACPHAVRKRLAEPRTTIRGAAPDAIEKIIARLAVQSQTVSKLRVRGPAVSHNQRCRARCITTRVRSPGYPCWRLLAGFDRPARSAMP